jgi:hypothetical protein
MPDVPNYPRVAQLRDVPAFRERLHELDLTLPIDDDVLSAAAGSPLAAPINVGNFAVGNRWCIHPMEGWDANRDGSPSEHTLRRWGNFGRSGAKLIWGGEAAAVRADGRANPNQTLATAANRAGLAKVLAELQTPIANHSVRSMVSSASSSPTPADFASHTITRDSSRIAYAIRCWMPSTD